MIKKMIILLYRPAFVQEQWNIFILNVYRNGSKAGYISRFIMEVLCRLVEKASNVIFVKPTFRVFFFSEWTYFNFLDIIKVDQKVYDIVEIPKPVGVPYLILEILGREKNTTKGLFIMNFEAKSTLTLVNSFIY